jgi:hypothetical protein
VKDVGRITSAALEDVEQPRVGLAAVKDDRLAMLLRDLELGMKGFLLLLGGGVVPVLVEPDFAEGDDGFLPEKLREACEAGFVEARGIVGMPSRGGENPAGVAFGDPERELRRTGIDSDDDEPLDAGRPRLLDRSIGIGEGFGVVEMAVGIDEHFR